MNLLRSCMIFFFFLQDNNSSFGQECQDGQDTKNFAILKHFYSLTLISMKLNHLIAKFLLVH